MGAGLTETITSSVSLQPFDENTVTIYVVDTKGVTSTSEVFCPVLHKYVNPPDASSDAVAPAHISISSLADAIGEGRTVISISSVSGHHASVNVTVYVVLMPGDT